MPRQLKCECGECPTCKARERMRRRHQEDPEHVRALDRARYKRDKDKRLAAMHAYQVTPEGRAAHNAAARRWARKNAKKRRAQVAVGNAIRDGRLEKGPCEQADKPARGASTPTTTTTRNRWR